MMTNAKKLPCNHIFHISCLRSWFQRQQTCPTCRMDVLQPRPPAMPAAQGLHRLKILNITLSLLYTIKVSLITEGILHQYKF
jgi:hypothetical protein